MALYLCQVNLGITDLLRETLQQMERYGGHEMTEEHPFSSCWNEPEI